jgi:hypothetical protein
LASGEEAVFRSVDELALGIQSGVVSPAALVFHGKSEKWLPITSHPEYTAARELANSIVATEDPGELEPLPTVGELVRGGTVPVYQMVSQSARELAARRRPRWIMPAASAFVGVILVAGIAAALVPTREPPEEALRPRAALGSAAKGSPSVPAAVDEFRAIRHAPYNLANRLNQAGAQLARTFTDSIGGLELGGLLDPIRLQSADSVAALQARLRGFRALRADFRARALALESAYQDSAQQLSASGAWSRPESVEWRARFVHLESAVGSTRTEAVLQALESLYTLLSDERAGLEFPPGQIRFARAEAGASYDRLRLSLQGFAEMTPADGERFPVPLALLLQGVRRSTLPPRAR